MRPVVKIRPLYPNIKVPKQMTRGSSGKDIYSPVYITINPGKIASIDVGFEIEIPKGYEIQIRSRSSLVHNHRIFLTDSLATIDNDFRGEMTVGLYNAGTEPYTVKEGDRIAQICINEAIEFDIHESDSIDYSTERGSGKMGSTGR